MSRASPELLPLNQVVGRWGCAGGGGGAGDLLPLPAVPTPCASITISALLRDCSLKGLLFAEPSGTKGALAGNWPM